MPEGDTVHLAARRLHAAFAGERLRRTDFRVPALATADLTGQTVREVVARGKHLLMRTDASLTVHSHFRMDGVWHVDPIERAPRGPAHEIRAILENATRRATGLRLPVLEILSTAREADAVGHLGPDVLGPDWNAEEAVRRLAAEPRREIGDAILDQRRIAGPGNVYKSEALFLRGVDPRAVVAEVDLASLVGLLKRLMEANRATAAQVTTGDTRRGREHWVYGRAGRPCRRCGTRIERFEQGDAGVERVTFRCPSCQPARAG